jgi:hypothetical protein
LNGVIRIDVDPRPRALRVLALENVRDAAAELDHLEPALDIALRVRDHLAVLGRQQPREFVHVRFDQPLELEHHARTALRVGRRPARLRLVRGGDRSVEIGLRAERHTRLDLAAIGIEHVAAAAAAGGRSTRGAACDQMLDGANGHGASPCFAASTPLPRLRHKR